jgi:hypothetical protein
MFWKKSKTKETVIEIPIKGCIHYCGFQYGMSTYNPYETYIMGLANNKNIRDLRKQFIEFLIHYRPHKCAEALNIKLSHDFAMWTYPWQQVSKDYLFDTTRYWFDDLDGIADLMTHFSDKGILSYRIDEEFMWLDRALFAVGNKGFLSGYYVKVLQMRKQDTNAYLLLDGNHRVSALTALGYDTVPAKITEIVSEDDVGNWHAVKNGFMSEKDAMCIFNAYFRTNTDYMVGKKPAKIIAPCQWLDLYNLTHLTQK